MPDRACRCCLPVWDGALSLDFLSSLSSIPFSLLLLLFSSIQLCQLLLSPSIRYPVSYRHRHSFLVILDKQNTYLNLIQVCMPS